MNCVKLLDERIRKFLTLGTGDIQTLGGLGGSATFTNVTATGQFLAADGAVGAPGYAFASQPSTGWWLLSSVMRASIAGTQAVQISTSYFAPGSAGVQTLGLGSFGWGRLYMDFTNTGTVGAVTINKASGRVNIAAAGTSVVVTNSVSTAAAHCFVNLNGAQDATARSVQADTSTPGQITIRLNAAATAQVAIDFFLVNAD